MLYCGQLAEEKHQLMALLQPAIDHLMQPAPAFLGVLAAL
jgi:hypothetical protein